MSASDWWNVGVAAFFVLFAYPALYLWCKRDTRRWLDGRR